MSDGKARLGAGDVRIVLVGGENDEPEEFVLKPSFYASRTLSNQSGGLVGVIDRLGKLDQDLATQVISLGAGFGGQTRRGPKDLAERIWRTGLSDEGFPQPATVPGEEVGGLAERCVTYVRILMAGGHRPSQTTTEAHDDTADPPTSA